MHIGASNKLSDQAQVNSKEFLISTSIIKIPNFSSLNKFFT